MVRFRNFGMKSVKPVRAEMLSRNLADLVGCA